MANAGDRHLDSGLLAHSFNALHAGLLNTHDSRSYFSLYFLCDAGRCRLFCLRQNVDKDGAFQDA